MLDFTLTVLMLCFIVVILSVTSIFVQIALERFITSTIPVIADLWLRLRYPDEFNKE